MDNCENCKVEIEDKKSNCPLCGKAVNKDSSRNNLYYPQYQPIIDKHEPVVSILQKLALLALFICIIVDLFITKTLGWSLYVVAGVALTVAVVLRAILKKDGIAQVLSRLSFWMTGFLVFIELYTHTWGWGVQYAIPFMWVAICITFGLTILIQGYVNFEMFKPLILILILSVTSFLLLFFLKCDILWPTLTAVLLSASEFILMFMFRFKRSIRSLKRDFGI